MSDEVSHSRNNQMLKTTTKTRETSQEGVKDGIDTYHARTIDPVMSKKAEATDNKHLTAVQQYQDVIFKPRRAMTKSLDFSATNYKSKPRNQANQTQLANTHVISKLN